MTAVVDASVVVSALTDTSPVGSWAERVLVDQLVAPHLMPVEVSNILRRLTRTGVLTADAASLAADDLGSLAVTFFAFEPFADRVWELRDLTSYDAWYVAVAEAVDAPLFTLDQRLSRASGPTCQIRTP